MIFLLRSCLSRTLELVIGLLSMLPPKTAAKYQALVLRTCGVKCGSRCHLGRAILISAPRKISFGEDVSISSHARLHSYESIDIGSNFMAAEGLCINTGTHNVENLEPVFKPVKIGRRVWCGVNVSICAGVTIGDDVVIGAGAVVVSDIPSSCIAVGVPCKPIKKLLRRSEKIFCSLT